MDNRLDELVKVEGVSSMQQPSEADSVYEKAKNLPIDERVELVKRLLGNHGTTTVCFGNSSVTADTVYQINLMSPDDMALVLEAIASKIKSPEASEEDL